MSPGIFVFLAPSQTYTQLSVTKMLSQLIKVDRRWNLGEVLFSYFDGSRVKFGMCQSWSYFARLFDRIHYLNPLHAGYSENCLKLPLKNRQNKGLKVIW